MEEICVFCVLETEYSRGPNIGIWPWHHVAGYGFTAVLERLTSYIFNREDGSTSFVRNLGKHRANELSLPGIRTAVGICESLNPLNTKRQTALFKDPVRTAQ
jgi:hypothetical protein